MANQAVAKSEDAALALCKLHGQINANVIIDGASAVQSGDRSDAHSLLASHGLIKAQKNILKTQRVLTCASICVLETVVGSYRAEKGRLHAIRTALPILHKLEAIAPTAAGIGGIFYQKVMNCAFKTTHLASKVMNYVFKMMYLYRI